MLINIGVEKMKKPIRISPINLLDGELPTADVPHMFHVIETDRTKPPASLLDHIQREAFPRVLETTVRDCGCLYERLDNGGATWAPCSIHDVKF